MEGALEEAGLEVRRFQRKKEVKAFIKVGWILCFELGGVVGPGWAVTCIQCALHGSGW